MIAYSRDGWSWTRPDRRAFLPVSETFGDWNYANVQSVGSGCLVVGDELRFYASARSGEKGGPKQGTCTTGLATLRRDGFASMDAPAGGGTLTTRPLRFAGRHLFVNLAGELRVEALDGEGRPRVGARERGPGAPARRVEGREGPPSPRGKASKVPLPAGAGRLYSFWVAADASGKSGGYVAAGGPAYPGPADR